MQANVREKEVVSRTLVLQNDMHACIVDAGDTHDYEVSEWYVSFAVFDGKGYSASAPTPTSNYYIRLRRLGYAAAIGRQTSSPKEGIM